MASLLDQINHEAIDGDLSKALRLCLQLGGETGSEALREWASLELNGYRGQEDIPDYRKIHAPLLIDAMRGNWKITGQAISNLQLPDFARDVITEEVLLTQPATQLVELEKDAQSSQSVRLGPPGATEVVAYMNATSTEQFQHINALYWAVSRSVLQGVIENIRSRLVALVAEMRAGLEPGQQMPSEEVASQAVGVAIHGDQARVKVRQSGHKVTVSSGDQKGWARKALEVGAWVAGIAILIVTVIVYWDDITGWVLT